MAVAAIHDHVKQGKAKEKASEICGETGLNESVGKDRGNELVKRGKKYIAQRIDTPSPHDATLYAIALRIGGDIEKDYIDPVFIHQYIAIEEM